MNNFSAITRRRDEENQRLMRRLLNACEEHVRGVLEYCAIDQSVDEIYPYTIPRTYTHWVNVYYPDWAKQSVEMIIDDEVKTALDTFLPNATVNCWSAAQAVIERRDNISAPPSTRISGTWMWTVAMDEGNHPYEFLKSKYSSREETWTLRCVDVNFAEEGVYAVSGSLSYCLAELETVGFLPLNLDSLQVLQYFECDHRGAAFGAKAVHLWVAKCHNGWSDTRPWDHRLSLSTKTLSLPESSNEFNAGVST